MNSEVELSTPFWLRNLPASVPCPMLEQYTVPEDDPRLLLRGQVGVRLKLDCEPVKRGQFLGFFANKTCHDACERNSVATGSPEEIYAHFKELARQDDCLVLGDFNLSGVMEAAGVGLQHLYNHSNDNEILWLAADKGNVTALLNAPQVPYNFGRTDRGQRGVDASVSCPFRRIPTSWTIHLTRCLPTARSARSTFSTGRSWNCLRTRRLPHVCESRGS